MKRFLKNNGLCVSLFTLYVIFQIGLSIAGMRQYNNDQRLHGQPPVEYIEYVSGAAFLEATMENWESEFLQMSAYVLMTAFLFQRGSPESKKIGSHEHVDDRPRGVPARDAAWPVRRGGIPLKLYESSLGLALLCLFFMSFFLHAAGGAREFSRQELQHGAGSVTTLRYIGTSQFWFESLQNWQSEFFSLGVMIVLSIFLRQRGSAESKPVDSPRDETGHGS